MRASRTISAASRSPTNSRNFENFTFSDGTLDLTTVFNRAPDAVDDTLANRTEDLPFTIAVSGLTGNDSDPDGNPITFVSVQDAVGGTVGQVGGVIIFEPTANYFGAASFTYTIRDPLGETDTATVNFNITAVNDAPVLDLDADNSAGGNSIHYNTAFTEGGARIPIVDGPSIIDIDDTQINSMTVTLTKADAADSLAILSSEVPAGIQVAVSISASLTRFTFTGAASLAAYETLLTKITFGNASDNPVAGPRTITVTVNDGEADSATAITTVTLSAVNDAPNAVDDTLAAKTEDTPFTIAVSDLTGNDNDPDGPFTLVSVQGPLDVGEVGHVGSVITFTPAANYFGAASFTYTIQDSFGLTDTATVSFNITAVNDAPVLDLDADNSAGANSIHYNTAFTEGGARIPIVDGPSIIDIDDTQINSLTVTLTKADAADSLAILSSDVPAGIQVAVSISASLAQFTFTGAASLAAYETLLTKISFRERLGQSGGGAAHHHGHGQ